jgi:hypothetical protein
MMIWNVLRDLPFSRNQPLKSADCQYIGILKNRTYEFLAELEKNKDDFDLN